MAADVSSALPVVDFFGFFEGRAGGGGVTGAAVRGGVDGGETGMAVGVSSSAVAGAGVGVDVGAVGPPRRNGKRGKGVLRAIVATECGYQLLYGE